MIIIIIIIIIIITTIIIYYYYYYKYYYYKYYYYKYYYITITIIIVVIIIIEIKNNLGKKFKSNLWMSLIAAIKMKKNIKLKCKLNKRKEDRKNILSNKYYSLLYLK